jgi:hypothetical protein
MRCGARFSIVDVHPVTEPPPLPQYIVVSLATGLLLSVRFLLSSIAKSEQVACACPASFCSALMPLRMLLPRQAHKKENEASHAGVHALPLHTRAADVDHDVFILRNRTQRLHVCESRVEILRRTMRAVAFTRVGGWRWGWVLAHLFRSLAANTSCPQQRVNALQRRACIIGHAGCCERRRDTGCILTRVGGGRRPRLGAAVDAAAGTRHDLQRVTVSWRRGGGG